jgi:uncharacterized protein DUF6745
MMVKTSDKLLTEKFEGPRYAIVAWARGHEVLYYREFGSYQGEWFMLSFCKGEYYLWKGSFGSCSGCDDFEADISYSDRDTLTLANTNVKGFVEKYLPFIEIPSGTLVKLVVKGAEAVSHIMPANINDDYGEFKMSDVLKDVCLLVKLKENMHVSVKDIIEVPDQEVKQAALKLYGYEKFCKDADAKVLDEDKKKGNKLLGVEEVKLLSLKDTSTSRIYLLRVPPEINSIAEGLAWTFAMPIDEYDPLIET